YHRPGIGDQPTSETEGSADESHEEERRNEQAAEDAAADDRIGERGHEGKQRAERTSPADGLREGPQPLIVEGVEVAQRKLQVAGLVPLGDVATAKPD